MGEEQRRFDVSGEVAKVRVPPCGRDAVIDARSLPGAVPAQPEPVAVGRLGAHAGVQALIDQAVLGLEEQLLDEHRLPVPRHPPTHRSLPFVTAEMPASPTSCAHEYIGARRDAHRRGTAPGRAPPSTPARGTHARHRLERLRSYAQDR